MAYDRSRGVTVLFGGRDSSGNELGDTWEWDGEQWSQKAATGPMPRWGAGLEYDPVGGGVLLFGGRTNPPGTFAVLGDTWRWDGSQWTELFPASPPPARQNHGMALDATGHVVLFSGVVSGGGAVTETWRWSGTDWSLLSPANTPTARNDFGMAYDSVRRKTVVFGGFATGLGQVDDTWEWDGVDWTPVVPLEGRPSPRGGTRMTFSACLQRVVLYGGVSGTLPSGIFHDDTWVWDGAGWELAPTPQRPHGSSDHSMIFDSARGVLLLVGGYEGFSDSSATSAAWTFRRRQ